MRAFSVVVGCALLLLTYGCTTNRTPQHLGESQFQTYFTSDGGTNESGNDNCESLLKGGIFDIIKVNRSDSLTKSYAKWLKEATIEDAQKAIDTGGSIILEGVPISGHLDASTWDNSKRYRETLDESNFSESQATEMFQQMADPQILQAYLQCRAMQSRKQGLHIDVTGNDSLLVVQLKFEVQSTGAYIDFDPPMLQRLEYASQTTQRFPKRLNINQTVTMMFNRTSATEAVGIVATTKNSPAMVQFMIPPPARAPSVDSVKTISEIRLLVDAVEVTSLHKRNITKIEGDRVTGDIVQSCNFLAINPTVEFDDIGSQVPEDNFILVQEDGAEGTFAPAKSFFPLTQPSDDWQHIRVSFREITSAPKLFDHTLSENRAFFHLGALDFQRDKLPASSTPQVARVVPFQFKDSAGNVQEQGLSVKVTYHLEYVTK